MGHPARHRPDGPALPGGPAQRGRVEAPKTWDDFAAAAETYHSKNPKSYLVNVAPNQPGQLVAYLWQAGVRPFSFDGKQTVKVDLANEEAKKVVKFWGDLVTNGTASNDTDFNDSWYQGLANGKYATLADRRLGASVPAGHGRQDVGQVAGRRPAAVGCQQGRCPATGAAPPMRC